MSSYVISCCSTADLTEEHFSKREISYICFHYKLNDTEYADDLGKSMPFDQFYAAMAAGASTKTSQVNADEFEAYFETFLQDGKDILHVCLSSGISGVLNSAMIAKADLEERYPERKILIVDSLGASSGYGLLMDRLADLRDEGKPLEEVYDFAMKNRLKVHHWFFSTDLTFYVRGGRISKASGAIGGLLGICPLLNMDNEGRLIPRFKIRTKKKVIKKNRRPDGRKRRGRPLLLRQMLHFPVRLLRRCAGRCGSYRGTLSQSERKSRDQQHRNHHRQPHRAGNRGIVFLGERTGGLTLLHFHL